jgi:MFS family permease
MVMVIFFGAILSSIVVSLPAIASGIFFIDVKDSGPLIIVPIGIGALFAISKISALSKKYRKKDLINLGLKIDLLVLLFLSLLLPFFGSLILPFGILMAFLLGFGGLLIFIPNQTLLQENIPSNIRARVFGTIGFFATVITLPVLLFSATLIDTAGIRPYLFITGAGLFTFLLFFKKAEKIIIDEINGVEK